MKVTRELAIRVLEELEQEQLDRARAAAKAGTLLGGPDAWERWRQRADARLSVLEVLRELVRRQPHELLREEG
jgi:hypothetical protein